MQHILLTGLLCYICTQGHAIGAVSDPFSPSTFASNLETKDLGVFVSTVDSLIAPIATHATTTVSMSVFVKESANHFFPQAHIFVASTLPIGFFKFTLKGKHRGRLTPQAAGKASSGLAAQRNFKVYTSKHGMVFAMPGKVSAKSHKMSVLPPTPHGAVLTVISLPEWQGEPLCVKAIEAHAPHAHRTRGEGLRLQAVGQCFNWGNGAFRKAAPRAVHLPSIVMRKQKKYCEVLLHKKSDCTHCGSISVVFWYRSY